MPQVLSYTILVLKEVTTLPTEAPDAAYEPEMVLNIFAVFLSKVSHVRLANLFYRSLSLTSSGCSLPTQRILGLGHSKLSELSMVISNRLEIEKFRPATAFCIELHFPLGSSEDEYMCVYLRRTHSSSYEQLQNLQ